MNLNKTLGYVLLCVGLLLIVLSLYQSYAIFTGKSTPPEIFKKQITQTTQGNNPNDMQQQIQKAMSNIIPAESVNKTLNLGSWLALAWVLIFGGSKLAGLGIQLIKAAKD